MRSDLPKEVKAVEKVWRQLRALDRQGKVGSEQYKKLLKQYIKLSLPIFGEMAKAVEQAQEAQKLRETLDRLTSPDLHTD